MKKNIFSGSVAVLAALIICKITAFLQEMIIAAYLGATAVGDAFSTVKSIQETIYPMLAVGISQVFLPAYKSMMVRDGREKADSLANYAILFFTGISVLVVILLIIFAPFAVRLVAPGFDAAQKELTAHLVRLSALSYAFICCASVLSSMLIANGRFFASEIRGAFTHIPIIIAALFFYERYGLDALAISIVVAGIARLVILLPFMPKGFRFTLRNPPERQYIKTLLARLPSALISSGITQLNTLVDKIMASNLSVGSISCLSYGTRLYMVLQELFANVVATSSYPQIIELIARDRKDELSKLLSKIICVIWFFTIPLTVGGIVYSENLVHVAFVRGAFTSEVGGVTAGVFIGYISALAFSSLNGIMNNVFFGFGDTKSPMMFNLLNLMLNVCLNFIFVKRFAVAGLAIATSISSVICLSLRVFYLQTKMTFRFNILAKQGLMILISSLIAVGISYAVVKITKLSGNLGILICGVTVSVVVYLFEMKIEKSPVYEEAIKIITSRFAERMRRKDS